MHFFYISHSTENYIMSADDPLFLSLTQLGDSQDSDTFPISFKRTYFYVSHSTENNITR